MLKAYVGIASGSGLVSFALEDDGSRRLIAVYTRYCPRLRTVSFWAAVPDEVAKDVRAHMFAGERYLALQTLAAGAVDIAPLPPSRNCAIRLC